MEADRIGKGLVAEPPQGNVLRPEPRTSPGHSASDEKDVCNLLEREMTRIGERIIAEAKAVLEQFEQKLEITRLQPSPSAEAVQHAPTKEALLSKPIKDAEVAGNDGVHQGVNGRICQICTKARVARQGASIGRVYQRPRQLKPGT